MRSLFILYVVLFATSTILALPTILANHDMGVVYTAVAIVLSAHLFPPNFEPILLHILMKFPRQLEVQAFVKSGVREVFYLLLLQDLCTSPNVVLV